MNQPFSESPELIRVYCHDADGNSAFDFYLEGNKYEEAIEIAKSKINKNWQGWIEIYQASDDMPNSIPLKEQWLEIVK